MMNPTVRRLAKIASQVRGGRKPNPPIAAATNAAHVALDKYSAGSRPKANGGHS